MSIISLKNINKLYDDGGAQVEALKRVDLEIMQGDMIAIMGASASGKTTLLNIMGLIDRSTGGTYELCGINIQKCNEKQLAEIRNRKLGFVVQDFALIERYSVLKNVMLPLYYSNVPRREWKIKAEKLLEKLNVPCDHKIYPTNLSGGQRQRVAIARALINDADIILADEPTGALDSKTADDVMNVFRKINNEGKTIVIVTHDPRIGNMCDKIVTISDGVIVAR